MSGFNAAGAFGDLAALTAPLASPLPGIPPGGFTGSSSANSSAGPAHSTGGTLNFGSYGGGVSTPVVIALAIVAAVVLLKRK